ncbi:hypothetical protein DPEC_G00001140 [Dallia pectoralis]|uniref:Uncharacterized protein n=1 Tax=Dallia pectoralis TaxID=75939 RepID=A0ACC2HJI2_DALPE|nr:hypothetical protein DPEC_G00001140 [Dallia pectoralis]
MIAVALVHAGMGPCTFSEKLFRQISGQVSGVPSISDVDDEDLQQTLENIKRASTIREAQAAVLEASPKLSMIGGLAPVKSLRGRDTLVDSIVSYYVYDRMQTAVNQFKEGLETLGVLEKLQSNAESFQNVFACGTKVLSVVDVTSLFSCNYSIEGSNKRAEEEQAVCFWMDWLNDVAAGEAFIQPEEDGEEKVTLRLEDILVFVTGASQIPPFGFDPMPTISFLHPTVLGGTKKRFPEANTCAIILHLPIHESYEEFSKWMCSGIIQSPIFGVA